MAIRVVRIDGVALDGNALTVRLTEGVHPLPAEWSGHVLRINQDGFLNLVAEARDGVHRLMLSSLLFRLFTQAGGLNGTFLANAPGKAVAFNVDGLSVGVGQQALMVGGAAP